MKKDSNEDNTEIVKTQTKKNPANTLFDSIKNKLVEVGVEYVKTNMEQSKKAIFGFIEKNIENKIRKEIRRYKLIILGFFILVMGMLFISYSIFQFISFLAGFPEYLTNLLYGFFLLLIGSMIYGINK